MKVKHVFFDLDNTLWDFQRNSELALIEMYKEKQVEKEFCVSFEAFHHLYYDINEALWVQLRDNEITKKDLRDRRFVKGFEAVGIYDSALPTWFEENYLERIVNYNHLVAGAEELMEYLTEKAYEIHIITNGFEEVSSRKVGLSKLNKYIKSLTTADDLGVRKPDKRIYTHALEKVGAKKSESIYIGDDFVADIEGATSFGIRAIYYNLEAVLVDEKYTSVADLLQIKKLL